MDQAIHTADTVLERIRLDGRAQSGPMVDDATGKLLRTQALNARVRRVLEIGTGVGYATLWLAAAVPQDGLLLTIESDPGRAALARRNIEQAGLSSRVIVIAGDARRYLHKVSGPFDLVFQDSDPGTYAQLHDRLVALLRPGGALICNHVREGSEIGDALAADPRIMTSFLSTGNGVAVSITL
jgi:predicted O-methyltransferase YrrM